ncbi:MAG: hypothetical protein LBS16_06805 [Prevotellaceae bacterium]|jgi:signal transduction histidine kinase|nr:hypothetical protein [Prevotellaceae bacterium]
MSINRFFFFYFFLVFFALIALITFFLYRHEKNYRAELFDAQLTFCNTLIHNFLQQEPHSWDEVHYFVTLLPEQAVRISVIDTLGEVIFDSALPDRTVENHLTRPEIAMLEVEPVGKHIRQSISTSTNYYYVAQRFPNYYIRSALPYDVSLRKALRTNLSFLYFMGGIQLLAMLLLYFISKHFSKTVAQNETRLKRQLTQNISHELKTPVTGILGFMESILENPAMAEDRKHFFVERSYQQAQRLQSLLQDISILNKLDEASHLYEKQPCNLIDIINDVFDDVHLQIEQKQAQVVLQLPADMPIVGNKLLLYSIFRNLVDNALAYGGEGVTITIISHRNDGFYYHFSFSDNGAGVSEKHIGHLFERFYRVDLGRSRKLGGTGLGLSIVKNAVLYHQGTILVRNGIAGGLNFSFTLRKK